MLFIKSEKTDNYITVEVLPEIIESGKVVLYHGTMWRGLLEGESVLPAGTPWPVKGYKETKFRWFGNTQTNEITSIILSDEIGISEIITAVQQNQIQVHIPVSVLSELFVDHISFSNVLNIAVGLINNQILIINYNSISPYGDEDAIFEIRRYPSLQEINQQ